MLGFCTRIIQGETAFQAFRDPTEYAILCRTLFLLARIEPLAIAELIAKIAAFNSAF